MSWGVEFVIYLVRFMSIFLRSLLWLRVSVVESFICLLVLFVFLLNFFSLFMDVFMILFVDLVVCLFKLRSFLKFIVEKVLIFWYMGKNLMNVFGEW